MQVIVNKTVVNYLISGQGSKQILLIHGWGTDLSSLKLLQDYFSDHYTVISLDLPGFGHSELPGRAWDNTDFASFVRDFLTKINYLQIDTIMAHSNGGAIAIEMVAKKMIKPKKLILIASAGIRTKFNKRNFVIRQFAHIFKIGSVVLPSRIRNNFKKKVYQKIGSDAFVREAMLDSFKKVVTQDISEDAKLIKIPTLLIYGQDDQATPVKYGYILQRNILNSRLEILPNCGHFIYQDQPEQLIKIIRGFLNV